MKEEVKMNKLSKLGGVFAMFLTVLVILVAMATPAHAASITYSFVTQLPLGTTYGTGSFTFDDALIAPPLPKTVTNLNLTAFSYSDPVAGSFTLANLGSLNFTLGTTTTTSSFAFSTLSADGLRSFTGGVVDGGNNGGLSTSVSFVGGVHLSNPSLRFPTDAGATTTIVATPEPSSMLLMAIGLAGIVGGIRKRR